MSASPLRVAYVGFGLIGAAVLGAYVHERMAPPPGPELALARPATPSAPPAAHPEAAGHVPAQRPEFTLRDLEGKPHRLADWDGHPLLVNFWATWCAPCRRELPLLRRLQQEANPKGLQVVGIAVDFADDVRAFLKTMPLPYPVLVGEEDGLEAARSFGVETMALPFTAFIDGAGHVQTVHLGELHEDQARAILKVLADVEAGRLASDRAPAAIQGALAALPPPPAATAQPLPIHPVQR